MTEGFTFTATYSGAWGPSYEIVSYGGTTLDSGQCWLLLNVASLHEILKPRANPAADALFSAVYELFMTGPNTMTVTVVGA